MLQAVGDILQALALGDLPTLQRHMTPDVVLHANGTSQFSGTFTGAGEVLAYAATSARSFDRTSMTVDEREVDGVEVRLALSVDLLLRSGSWRARIVHRYHFDPEGLVDRITVDAADQEEFDRMAGSARMQ